MQLLESSETNLFNALTEEEQEAVVGANGGISYTAAIPYYGGSIAFANGGNYSSSGAAGAGYFQYTAPNGQIWKYSWNSSSNAAGAGYFQYTAPNGQIRKYSWSGSSPSAS